VNIVAILPADHIGDTLFVFPILSALRAKYKDAHITFVSYALVAPLAQEWGFVDEVFDRKDEQWKELSSPGGIRSAKLLDLFGKTDCVICWEVDMGGVISHNLRSVGVKAVFVVPENPIETGSMHVADFMAKAAGLQSLGIENVVAEYAPPRWEGGNKFCFFTPPIAVHPGSTDEKRRWPAPYFATVINQLIRRNYPVLLLAGPSEAETLASVRQYISPNMKPGMLTILGNKSLLEVAQQLKQSRFFLGNDSGIGHLAGLLGVPMLALFGPTDPSLKRPAGPYVETLQEMPMDNLSPGRVLEHILQRL
jgi:heptosyltransferase-3